MTQLYVSYRGMFHTNPKCSVRRSSQGGVGVRNSPYTKDLDSARADIKNSSIETFVCVKCGADKLLA